MVNSAVLRVARSARLAPLLPPGLAACAEEFARAAPPTLRFGAALGWLGGSVASPGLLLHVALRKRYVEDQVRAGLAAGARQVVVLGAGIDTLAVRLVREHADVAFFELDRPATQAHKRALGCGGVQLLAADFETDDWRHLLATAPGFRRGARSVFVAEGLLMYLRAPAVDGLFTAVRELGGAGSRLVFSHTELTASGRQRNGRCGGVVRWALRRRGEPFRSGVPWGTLPAFLAARGLRLVDAPGVADLRARYAPLLDGRRLAGWERLAVANTEPVQPSESGCCP